MAHLAEAKRHRQDHASVFRASFAARLAELTLNADFADAVIVCTCGNAGAATDGSGRSAEGDATSLSERVNVVRANFVAACPAFENCFEPNSASDTVIPELELPISAIALRCALVYCCGALPVGNRGSFWSIQLLRCPTSQLRAAAKVLKLPGLEAWWRDVRARASSPTTENGLTEKRGEHGTQEQHGSDEDADEKDVISSEVDDDETKSPSCANGERRRAAEPYSSGDSIISSRLPLLVCSGGLAAVAFGAWLPALHYNFELENRRFMDDAMIWKNRNVYEDIDWKRIFRTDYWGLELFDGSWTHKSWRPLAVLTFRLNHWLHGFNSSGFHIANIALLVASSGLLGILGATSLGLPLDWALLLAALFLAHPVHTESVLYIVGRADLLCFTLVLLATLVYVPCLTGRVRSLSFSASLLLIASAGIIAGGLCKETGFCFFGLLAGWEILRILVPAASAAKGTRSEGFAKKPDRRSRLHRLFPNVVRLAAILVLGGAACAWRCWYTGGTSIIDMDPHSNPIAVESDLIVRVLSYCLVHGIYAKLLVWPMFLCYDYSFDAVPLVRSFLDVRLLLPLAAYSGFAQLLTFAMWPLLRSWQRSSRRNGGTRLSRGAREAPIVGLAIVLLSFFPMSNILFPVGTMIGERLMYMPSGGFLLAIVGFGRLAEARLRRPWKHAPAAILLVAGVAGVWLCAKRVPDWSSADAITVADGQKQLRSGRVQFNYGNVFNLANKHDEALVAYRRAIDVDPKDEDALPLHHAGQILLFYGHHQEAVNYLHRAASGSVSPLVFQGEEVFHDYGLALWFVRDVQGAVLNFRKSITFNQAFTKGWNNLGCVYGLGVIHGFLPHDDLRNALQAIDMAVRLNPANVLYWRNAVVLLQHSGDQAMAASAWQQVLALDPESSTMPTPRECVWEFSFR
eukprot:TRINITY_DN9295_c0_g1_i1.p1 TRINITY_DN9295_c0_g1~~TRINITY_DN9295_c0_g1_i1.p1  ORF type:complete len:914 (+),score=134.14 TRINITY_DN9295_c0_g1_i1:40-2781(+)